MTTTVPENGPPRKIHFILVAREARDLALVEYIAIKSAALCNPDFEITLHSNIQPAGPRWDILKHSLILKDVAPPLSIDGKPILRVPHRVDILKLRILIEHGGIYLDLDTICLKGLEGFLRQVVVMGEEAEDGLCNAFIASPQNAEFLRVWLDGYRDFHNRQWNEFSVRLPKKLQAAHPHLVHVEPRSAFFLPGYSAESLENLFVHVRSFPEAYIFHLWATLAKNYIAQISVDAIFESESTYNLAARAVIGEDRSRLALDVSGRRVLRSDE